MQLSDGTLLDSTPIEIPSTTMSMFRRLLNSEDFQRFSASGLYAIRYASQGWRINGFMALPPAEDKPLPAIIFNRGGSAKGALTPMTASQTLGLYAAWGYVAVASQYRGSGGSEGPEEWGGGDVDDVLNLTKLLVDLDYVDRNRLGIIGGSRGGMMAMQMLTRSDRFRAAVTFGAPSRFDHLPKGAFIRKLMTRYLSSDADFEAEARKRSAEFWAADMCKSTPLLVLHGTGDRRVDPQHALRLAAELQAVRHPYKLILYDNADHVLAGRRRESNADIRWWMDNYVKHLGKLPIVGPHGA